MKVPRLPFLLGIHGLHGNVLTNKLDPLVDFRLPHVGRDPPDVGEQVQHLPPGEHVDDGVKLGAVADVLERKRISWFDGSGLFRKKKCIFSFM